MTDDYQKLKVELFPEHWSGDVLATDGGVVHLRPIMPSDAEALVEFHRNLSERTRYMRYFGSYPTIPPRDLKRMTSIDYNERMAFVGFLADEIIAVASYESLKMLGKPNTAEVAFVVADAHQGRGLGPIMLEHLAAAAGERGYLNFEAEVLSENPNMVAVFRDAGYQIHRSFEGATNHVEFTINLTETLRAIRNSRERASEARSVKNILFPTSVAVIGASNTPTKVGHALLNNIVCGGFTGPVYPVNSESKAIGGIRSYESVSAIPDEVDLAVVAVPAVKMDAVLDDCLAKGVKALVIVSSGFADGDDAGQEAETNLVGAVRERGMRLVGPNALGIANTDSLVSLNATLAPVLPQRGNSGFFCQSGALGIAILNTAARRQIGLSSFVSAGNRADLSGNDMLQYWDRDDATEVILLYLESFGNPRKFSRLARRVAQNKPIVAIKSPQNSLNHSVLLEHSGVTQVETIAALFDCAAIFAYQPLPQGPNVQIIGNSTVLAKLAESRSCQVGLVVNSRIDLGPLMTPSQFSDAVSHALLNPKVDAVLAVFVPPLAVNIDEYAQALLSAAQNSSNYATVQGAPLKPIVTNFLAVEGIPEGLRVSDAEGRPQRGSLPSYPEPERAAMALGAAWRYASWRKQPRTPLVTPEGCNRRKVAKILEAEIVSENILVRELAENVSAEILMAYGIAVSPFYQAASADSAVERAEKLGYPVAVKAIRENWRQRVDGEGVRLDLHTKEAVVQAFTELAERSGEAQLHIQKMAPKGVTTRLRISDDSSFGSLLSFELGGIASELVDDKAYRALPLTEEDIIAVTQEPRFSPLLDGYRGQPPVNREALYDILRRAVTLIEDHPCIRDLWLNPVLIGTELATALNAAITIGPVPSREDTGPRWLP